MSFFCIDDTPYKAAAYRLRYQIFCKERLFLEETNYLNGEESDEFDENAIHFGAVNHHDQVVGTIRLILPQERGFPVTNHCEIASEIPPHTAEISRLAVLSRELTKACGTSKHSARENKPIKMTHYNQRPDIVLGLYRAMYLESKRRGIHFWLAAMETPLMRILRRLHFEFKAIGPEVDYYGPVTPYLAKIADIEEKVRKSCPDLYRSFTAQNDPDFFLPASALNQASK